MNYKSTRNAMKIVSASQAIVQGISEDGGLFVPETLPHYEYTDLQELQNLNYEERAERILNEFLSEFSQCEIKECVTKAYSQEKFSGDKPAPLILLQNGSINMYMLELWHGPTCAFKDMALQLLPYLLSKSLQKINCSDTAVILVATSGDTGKAALEGFKNVDGTKMLVFYPENGVSTMQKLQMNSQEGDNVGVCAIKGNFDDAQTGVKNIFTDAQMNQILQNNGMLFSSANSINWGRLLPQIVYYFSAYCDLMATGEMDYEGEKVNIVVPTGNFGNILAAYYAKKMGLPVNKLVCASNSNNVLTEFLKTGVYDRNRQFYTTISPSMDILVSSNLERLLYDLTDGDSVKVTSWMKELSAKGKYQVDADTLSKIQELFYSGCCDDNATKVTIQEMFQTENYLCDTHTAVAVNVYHQYVKEMLDAETPSIIVSTASPYKFADSVMSALGNIVDGVDEFAEIQELSAVTGVPVPTPILELQTKDVRFSQVCAIDKMKEKVLEMVGVQP